MSYVVTDNRYYTEIAAAIREKLGSTDLYKPSEMAAAILAISGGSKLPSGYTELAYIQNSGTQWIDTGYAPSQNTKVVVDADVLPLSASFPAILGSGDSGKFFYIFSLDDSSWSCDVISPRYTIDVSRYGRHTFTLDAKNKVFQVDSLSSYISVSAFQSSCNVGLFCINRSDGKTNSSVAKIYSCKIYDNDTLVRDFIPCINPSGAYGLYDMVNAQFYGNAGSGSFTGA